MKLMSLTKRIVDEYNERIDTPYNDGVLLISDAEKWSKHALFLSQKLSLEMFVPCKLVEGVWVVLEEPKEEIEKIQNNFCRRKKEDILDLYSFDLDVKEYKEAKKSVLFEGFNLEIIPETEFTPGYKFIVGKNIRIHVYNLDKCNVEYLLLLSNEIILTPTAQKQIGL